MCELCWVEISFPEAVANCRHREAVIVLLSGETLLLRGGNDPAILYEAGSRIMVEGRYAENACFYWFLLTGSMYGLDCVNLHLGNCTVYRQVIPGEVLYS